MILRGAILGAVAAAAPWTAPQPGRPPHRIDALTANGLIRRRLAEVFNGRRRPFLVARLSLGAELSVAAEYADGRREDFAARQLLASHAGVHGPDEEASFFAREYASALNASTIVAGFGGEAEARVARTLAPRAAFVDRKRREAGPADASKCWAAAMANCEVEDVADAVCLSIRLPALTDVRVAHRNRLVTITAKRGGALQALTNDRAKDRGPRSLAMKFELVSPEDARDVSYEYDCGSGYLHVFLDGIKLGKMSDAQKTRTLASIRGRLAAAAASRLSALKKAVSGGGPLPGGATSTIIDGASGADVGSSASAALGSTPSASQSCQVWASTLWR